MPVTVHSNLLLDYDKDLSFSESESGTQQQTVVLMEEPRSLMSCIRTVTFWQMFNMYYCGMFLCVYNSSVFKSNASGLISDHVLTLIASFGSVSNGISSLVMATIMDKISFKRVYTGTMLLQLIVAAVIYHVRDVAVVYAICVTTVGWCHGVHCSCFPAASVQIFGIQYGG